MVGNHQLEFVLAKRYFEGITMAHDRGRGSGHAAKDNLNWILVGGTS